MSGPIHVLSARLQSETPVSTVALEPYVLCRRADGTTVSAGEFQAPWMLTAGSRTALEPRSSRKPLTAASPRAFSAEEVPAEGHTDSRFSVKCRWYRSVVTKGGQVRRRWGRRERLFVPLPTTCYAEEPTPLLPAVLLGAPGERGGDPVHPVPALQGTAGQRRQLLPAARQLTCIVITQLTSPGTPARQCITPACRALGTTAIASRCTVLSLPRRCFYPSALLP